MSTRERLTQLLRYGEKTVEDNIMMSLSEKKGPWRHWTIKLIMDRDLAHSDEAEDAIRKGRLARRYKDNRCEIYLSASRLCGTHCNCWTRERRLRKP